RPALPSRALGAVLDHTAATALPGPEVLERIARYERRLFSAATLRGLARGRTDHPLPEGKTDAERRGRRFFEDRLDPTDPRVGFCAVCHSGPLLNQTNQLIPLPPPAPGRPLPSSPLS